MRSFRSAPLGSISAWLPIGLGALCALGCATASNGPAGSMAAAKPALPEVSTSAAAPVDPPTEGIALGQLQGELGFRGPASFRVHRNVRQAGALDPSGESSSGVLTLDEHGTVLWSFDDPALSLRIAGYELRSRDLCVDARHRFAAEWFAVAPLLPTTTGAFRIQGVPADGDGARYVAEAADAELFPQVETRVLYRPLDTTGKALEVVVLQRWRGAPSRWRTFRYELRQTADLTSSQNTSLAPCTPGSDGAPKEKPAESESR